MNLRDSLQQKKEGSYVYLFFCESKLVHVYNGGLYRTRRGKNRHSDINGV